MATRHVKWNFNVSRWQPTRDDWLKLTSSIDEEELDRINKFVYKEDAKSSIIGRSLIRKFVSEATNQPSDRLSFARNRFGRPQFIGLLGSNGDISRQEYLDFNVSHSGDHCVLIGAWNERPINISVGVDVTKIVSKQSKSELDRFLDLMSRREFTSQEWDLVKNVDNDRQKCINFTRLWCLKESFIKSIGMGLHFKLNRISFIPNETYKYNLTIDMLKNRIVDSTKVLLDEKLASDWYFQESALDEEHLVASGYNFKSEVDTSDYPDLSPFQELTIGSVLDALRPIACQKESEWQKFQSKYSKDHTSKTKVSP